MNCINIGITLLTLICLEIILGIDNLLFLSILTEKLPIHARERARYWGLTFAWLARLFLLAFAVVLVGFKKILFVFHGISFSFHSLFLLLGGLFLVAKAVQEIHFEMSPQPMAPRDAKMRHSFWQVVSQVVLMDLVFSFDSVMTAVGLTTEFWIMAVAISIAIIGMLYLSATITEFIRAYPTIKMLALSFLLLIGTFLISDGFSFHIPREYLYVVLVFSLSLELLNILKGKKQSKGRK
ncbi:MAG: TerC family protein [Legionellales bacterium]|nr:TerC family protein [Legionellales bacterium]